jgi:hypothetical protein
VNRKEAFDRHYKENLFKGKESKSGPGSDPDQTKILKEEIVKLCKHLGVKRLLDAPCGDCNWMKDIWGNLNLEMYIGMDIVEELINSNKNSFGSENKIFYWCDLVETKTIPSADLMLCRDCLVHLSFVSSIQVLKNMVNSDINYFLLTTFSKPDRHNYNWEDGTNWYPITLTDHPFYLPEPKVLINEGCTEYHNEYTDKCLGLWTREEIKQACGT